MIKSNKIKILKLFIGIAIVMLLRMIKKVMLKNGLMKLDSQFKKL